MAIRIQAKWKGIRLQSWYGWVRRCTILIQALIRGKLARIRVRRMLEVRACVKIQSFARRCNARTQYLSVCRDVVLIQSVWRGYQAREHFVEFRLHLMSSRIQAAFRSWRQKDYYYRLRVGVVKAQLRWRQILARKQLKRLRLEQRETAALFAQKQILQKEVLDLKRLLQEKDAHIFHVEAERDCLREQTAARLKEISNLRDSLQATTATVNEATPTEKGRQTIAVATGETSAEKDVKIAELKNDLNRREHELAAQKKENHELSQRYQTLLQGEALPYRKHPSLGALSSDNFDDTTPRDAHQRNVDVLLIGGIKVGKTSMLRQALEFFGDTDNIFKLRNDEFARECRTLHHYRIQLPAKTLTLLDIPGYPEMDSVVRDWTHRAHWIIVVYNCADSGSFDRALSLSKIASGQARVVLFGNKYDCERLGKDFMVDMVKVKDSSARMGVMSVEGESIVDVLRNILAYLPQNETTPSRMRSNTSRELRSKGQVPVSSALGGIFQHVKQYFIPEKSAIRQPNYQLLRPSLEGTSTTSRTKQEGFNVDDLVPVQEFQDNESAITCMVFGQEKTVFSYILLAVAAKDGSIIIYRFHRTEMEQRMQSPESAAYVDESVNGKHSNISTHNRLTGHQRAVTSLFFSLLEDQLVSTSIDKSVRLWDVEKGDMLKVFTDSSPALVAAFLPFNPSVFIASNANAVLRLVNIQNGTVMQKLKVDSEIRALKFDDTGLFCLAGTKTGTIHVLEATDNQQIKFKFKINLTANKNAAITCICFVPSSSPESSPCLLVNCCDSSVAIIDCVYGPPAGVLTNLTVRHRVKVAHSLLPLRSCYSQSGGGWLISASEDKEVYVYSLAKGANYKGGTLKYHKSPILVVAVNALDTLIVSGDSAGQIVLWRRQELSHLDGAHQAS